MSRFKDNNDGTITDTKTGLMWQKDHTGPMSWQDAMNYAESLSLTGHDNWRLPTIEEAFTLIDFGKYNPASAFPNMLSKWFWSSSSYAPSSYCAWSVYFGSGYMGHIYKTSGHYIRCVHRKGHWL